MPNGEKKGITVRIDADLHAEVSQYLRDHGMTMAEFVSLALDDELHPKNQMKEGNNMANTRTIAVQVPEDLFQRIKDYLQRNNMTQRQFLIGLIEDELERDQTERESQYEAVNGDPVPFPVSWTVKMKKKQKETQDILSYHTQAAGCSDKARAKASGGRQPIEECGRTGL